MNLTSLYIHNFKGFKESKLTLNGKSTVIFGVNGSGKSTVLSAINYLFWSVLNRLNNSQGTAFRSLNADSVHVGHDMVELAVSVDLDGTSFSLQKDYIKARPGKPARTVSYKEQYDTFIEHFVANYLSEDTQSNMPIFVNYGTNRSVLDIPLRIRNSHEFMQITALERALENSLDFRTFFEWFRNQEDLENEIKTETKNLDYEDIPLKCVRTAVSAILGDVSDLKVKRNPLRMTVKKGGVEIRVDDLSDGEKCTLALFGDLARRIALANPYRENPLEGSGIVLIDEIELHMHPSWQRKILGALKNTFPNIQFIVTTHSPQVLGEVDSNYNLFGLIKSDNDIEVTSYGVYGWDSNGILQSIMDTPYRSDAVNQYYQAFYDAVDHADYDSASHILKQLEDTVAPSDPELTACKIQLDLECR